MKLINKIILAILNPFSKVFNDRLLGDITSTCSKNPWIIFMISVIVTILIMIGFNIFVI